MILVYEVKGIRLRCFDNVISYKLTLINIILDYSNLNFL